MAPQVKGSQWLSTITSNGRNTIARPPPLACCSSSRVWTRLRGTRATSQSPSCASKGCGLWVYIWTASQSTLIHPNDLCDLWKLLCHYPGLVCCSDGVGRTGSFICIHAMLERVNTENIVDFFQFIKSSRIHRPHLVLELVSGCGLATNTSLMSSLSTGALQTVSWCIGWLPQ